MIDEIFDIVWAHEEWRGKQCLNLIPSENIMSPSARALLSSEFAHRYTARDRFYMGTRFTDEIEEYGEKLAKKVCRGISGIWRIIPKMLDQVKPFGVWVSAPIWISARFTSSMAPSTSLLVTLIPDFFASWSISFSSISLSKTFRKSPEPVPASPNDPRYGSPAGEHD
jgi:hypothetical protein